MGIDLGVSTAATLSSGEKLAGPKAFDAYMASGAVLLAHSARAGPRGLPMVGYFTAKLTVTTACVSIGWLASVAGR